MQWLPYSSDARCTSDCHCISASRPALWGRRIPPSSAAVPWETCVRFAPRLSSRSARNGTINATW